MPLLDVRPLNAHTRIGLWHMTETPDAVCAAYPSLTTYLHELSNQFRSTARLMERLSVRALLTELTGDAQLAIGHEPSGRPTLEGWHLSISHTRGYAVLMLSDMGGAPVGIDIEQRSERVRRIASRFMRPDEPFATTEQMLLVWSAKETLYKLHSADALSFSDMRISQIGSGRMLAENLRRGVAVPVGYEVTPDYVLTYAGGE